ncbi:flagellar operon protein TIGR03826 [Schinkia azotoformans MEV2011]|uniref:Flagellar operon protein TIGR03826 n=1 Tax=Schinkia azotoformans MEV2011 TaxID=1348973 RepID=A0A072NRK8_SCHAZ|nr:TIGR03826 family flagellar region protein [Schinkia azotoformans]KEF40334.1 flagellar operon protein TIGR03826 [Schinkia azotoformans MEV2011]MEC1696357.1 hypothetical protein [Schinkia azotoformans]MEC1715527.1 hypothetical protein [Schinkia azotoformans]MEC1724029.1 hypothetical protein [Schinkia azotoformans]MEC1743413.1 hypothetical protein [Schinkia azotoformans]
MPDLDNCSRCGRIYVRNIRGICDVCRKEEDQLFDKVYQFIKKRQNRTATMLQIVEATGVPEETIMRFVKEGRLKPAQFPNLGYPCERCGTVIQSGKLCPNCASNLESDLKQFEYEEERKRQIAEREKKTYFTDK